MNHTTDDRNRRILVIDDNRAIHEDFRKILVEDRDATAALDEVRAAVFGNTSGVMEQGFQVDSAYQGREGLKLVRKAIEVGRPYAMAFVDVRMPPGWDGVETIRHLWREDATLQAVICSAYSDHSWEDLAQKLGVSDRLLILRKPFENIEIRQLAVALTEKWSLARQASFRRNELERAVEERTVKLRTANQRLQKEITERQAAQEQLQHNAFHDALTDLPNRSLLLDRLGCCVERAKRHPEYSFAVLFLDIDNFKTINDSLGHRLGDELLIEVARRLVEGLRRSDTVGRVGEDTAARWGGDEFVIVLDGIRQASDAVVVANRIQKQLSPPLSLDGHEVTIGASIGIALGEHDGDDAEQLLRSADTAMYRAKQAGKARCAVFDETMHVEVMKRLELENALRAALDRGQLYLVYQPIVLLETGAISGFEALLRWAHPDRGHVPPDEFIPIAEDIGLILPVGRWVLHEACRQLRTWKQDLGCTRALSISVNVSRKQLVEPGFCADVEQVLSDTGIGARNLNLEITETAIIEAPERASEAFRKLKQFGVQLHMDDFGKGYSSLSFLHGFPFDVLKIDRTFVTNTEARRDYAAVIHAIVTLARNLDMKVIAEGVETKEQLAQIIGFDCDFAQGYYFSKPVDPATAQELITSEAPWLTPAQTGCDPCTTEAGP